MEPSFIFVFVVCFLAFLVFIFVVGRDKGDETETETADADTSPLVRHDGVSGEPERYVPAPVERSDPGEDEATFTDERDGNSYRWIRIGKLDWTRDNLRFKCNGCWANGRPEDVGYLYSRRMLQEACPSGWRIPDKEDFEQLIELLGGEDAAGTHLVKGGSSGFDSVENGRRYDDGRFTNEEDAYYWTSTEDFQGLAWFARMNSGQARVVETWDDGLKAEMGTSLRCVRDTVPGDKETLEEGDSDERSAVFAPQKKLLEDHFEIQSGKAREIPSIPEEFIGRCEEAFYRNIDDVTWKAVNCLFDAVPLDHHYEDEQTGIFMVVTTLPWTTEECVSFLVDQSNEDGFGYFSMFARVFLNNWPSSSLTGYLHVVLALGGGRFRMHTALGDYGGSPTAPREFGMLPFDLLTEREREGL